LKVLLRSSKAPRSLDPGLFVRLLLLSRLPLRFADWVI
jgi:hypothetical protein